ncbi:MAG: hypothetical protein LBT52_05220 [Clostridiales Family XIII bacterium]|jgi:hypothetical protein|nr:hypothetical protein [Clostridiales Family XIII bacterium]
MMAAAGSLTFLVVGLVLVIVFIVWFIKTLNRIRDALERMEMRLMGYSPLTGDADTMVTDGESYRQGKV